jgi:hypothetical protein
MEDLQSHKIKDIVGFIKAGNLPMVKALVEYYELGISVILLKGDGGDEFVFDRNHKLDMTTWNPLLIAIAYKRLDIVRFMLQDLHISFKHAARDPDI